MSSPSVSKSVAIVTRVAFLASFWSSATIFFSVGTLTVGASIRLRGVRDSSRQFEYSPVKSTSTTCPRRPMTVVPSKL